MRSSSIFVSKKARRTSWWSLTVRVALGRVRCWSGWHVPELNRGQGKRAEVAEVVYTEQTSDNELGEGWPGAG